MGIMLSHPLFILMNMATKTAPAPSQQGQLHLVIDEVRTPWRLDETTRQIGREGVARARQVLRASRAEHLDPEHLDPEPLNEAA